MLPASRTVRAIAAAFALVACAATACLAASPYTPPATEAAADGWLDYVDAPMVGGDAADDLNPAPDSPEAAVVRFLASQVRGDDAWRDAMTASPSARTERAIAAWDEWQLERFQLRGRRDIGPNEVAVRVFFKIGIGGDTDEGEDDFEVACEADGWRIVRPPT